MNDNPVIKNVAYCLVHAPELVRYGSRPRRSLGASDGFAEALTGALRNFDEARRYPPNQTYIGNLSPAQLAATARPWYERTDSGQVDSPADGPFGEIIAQDLFYALLAAADVLTPGLVALNEHTGADLIEALARHPILGSLAPAAHRTSSETALRKEIDDADAVALGLGATLAGCVRRDARAEGREDVNLDAITLLEALSAKASAALALTSMLHRAGVAATDIDFIVSCGEEATGDRYQRGGGGMAKAVGEMCGCTNASGFDVKNFCAAPGSALITAGALVKAGIHERVAVVAGGSLAKLGMKSPQFIEQGMPILDDCLGAHAFLVTRDDGVSPLLRLETGATGTARIGASTSDEAVYHELIREPLTALGLNMTDIDKYAPELHNPEIMEHAGSGDVVHKNYRMIAATAVMAGAIAKRDMAAFSADIGMTGFAPTQGHIPSGVPYIGHAMAAMAAGEIKRAMFLCKASLFLNRITELYDGVSFVLERNPARQLR